MSSAGAAQRACAAIPGPDAPGMGGGVREAPMCNGVQREVEGSGASVRLLGRQVRSASGVQPIQVPPLPEGIAALCNRQIAIQELVVEAALTGCWEIALQALVLDPVVPDIEAAHAVLDELLAVHAPYLAQFA